MAISYTQIIDNKLKDRLVKRVGNYIDTFTPIEFECLIENCHHRWNELASKIGYGIEVCPKCFPPIRKAKTRTSKEEAETFARRNLVQMLEPFVNGKTSIKFQCLKKGCEKIFEAVPIQVFKSLKKCPDCKSKELRQRFGSSKDEVDRLLEERSIKNIGEFINYRNKTQVECVICNYKWQTSIGNILNSESGCVSCMGIAPVSNEILDKRLEGRNIQRIENFQTIDIPIDFLCLNDGCGNIWKASPDSVVGKMNSGCPICNTAGINEKLLKSLLDDFAPTYNLCIKRINKEAKSSRLDFYFKDINFAIELNGTQHYKPVCFGGMPVEKANENFKYQQERDQYKRDFCQQNNIELLEIDGRLFKGKKLKEAVENILIPYIKEKANDKK